MRLRNVESVTFTQYSPLFWGAQHADAAHKGRNTSPPNGGILTSAPPCSFEHGAPIFRVTDSLAERDRQDRRPGQCARGRLLTSSFVDPNHRGAVPSRDPPRPPAPRRMFFHPLDARTPWTRPQTFGRVVNGIRVEQWRMLRRLLPGYGRKLRPAHQVCIREYGFYRGFWGWRLIRE